MCHVGELMLVHEFYLHRETNTHIVMECWVR